MLAKDNIVSVNSSFFTSKRLVFLSTFFLIAFLALLLPSFISLFPLLITILYAIGFSILGIATISLLIFDFRVDWHNKQSRFIILLMIALSVVGLFSLFWASIIIGTIFLTAAFTLLIGVLQKYIAKWEILFFILPIISLLASYLFFPWLALPLLGFTSTFLVLNGFSKLYRRLLATNNNFTRRSVLVVFSIVSLLVSLVFKQDLLSPILIVLNITSIVWTVFFISLSIIVGTILLMDMDSFGVLKINPSIPKQDNQSLSGQPREPQLLSKSQLLSFPAHKKENNIVDESERKETKKEKELTISKQDNQSLSEQPRESPLLPQSQLLPFPDHKKENYILGELERKETKKEKELTISKQDNQLLSEQPRESQLLPQTQQLTLQDPINEDKILDDPENKEIKEEESITINTPVCKSDVIQQKIYQPFIAELVEQMLYEKIPFTVNDDFLNQNQQLTLITLLLFYLKLRKRSGEISFDIFCECKNKCFCNKKNKPKINKDGKINFNKLMNITLENIKNGKDSISGFYETIFPSLEFFLKYSNIDTIARIDVFFFEDFLNIKKQKN